MTVEELQVLITANTKDFNAKIDKANKRLGSLEQQATRTGAGVGKLFTGLKSSERSQEADGRIRGKRSRANGLVEHINCAGKRPERRESVAQIVH